MPSVLLVLSFQVPIGTIRGAAESLKMRLSWEICGANLLPAGVLKSLCVGHSFTERSELISRYFLLVICRRDIIKRSGNVGIGILQLSCRHI